MIKQWYDEDKEFKENTSNTYPTHHFRYAFHLLMTLINRLYSEAKSSQFKVEWIPLVAGIVES